MAKAIERRLVELERGQAPAEDDGIVIVNMQTGAARDLAGNALTTVGERERARLMVMANVRPGYLEVLL
jgi:hypothetical protein